MRFTLARRKRPNEKFSIGIDFTNDLEVGDALTNTRTTTVLDGADGSDATGTVFVSDSVAGNIVSALIQAGAAGHQYRVIFKVTTQLARIYEHEILVNVDAAG